MDRNKLKNHQKRTYLNSESEESIDYAIRNEAKRKTSLQKLFSIFKRKKNGKENIENEEQSGRNKNSKLKTNEIHSMESKRNIKNYIENKFRSKIFGQNQLAKQYNLSQNWTQSWSSSEDGTFEIDEFEEGLNDRIPGLVQFENEPRKFTNNRGSPSADQAMTDSEFQLSRETNQTNEMCSTIEINETVKVDTTNDLVNRSYTETCIDDSSSCSNSSSSVSLEEALERSMSNLDKICEDSKNETTLGQENIILSTSDEIVAIEVPLIQTWRNSSHKNSLSSESFHASPSPTNKFISRHTSFTSPNLPTSSKYTTKWTFLKTDLDDFENISSYQIDQLQRSTSMSEKQLPLKSILKKSSTQSISMSSIHPKKDPMLLRNIIESVKFEDSNGDDLKIPYYIKSPRKRRIYLTCSTPKLNSGMAESLKYPSLEVNEKHSSLLAKELLEYSKESGQVKSKTSSQIQNSTLENVKKLQCVLSECLELSSPTLVKASKKRISDA